MSDTEEFQSADAGSANTYPVQCSSLRKGGFVVIKTHPCKIVEMSTSKTGKHGHAKVHMVALDIFTNKKYEDICPSTHNMEVPNVNRKEYQLLDIEDGFMSLMDNDNGTTRDDVPLPPDDELKKKITEGLQSAEKENKNFNVTVLKAMGDEQAISCKESN